MNNWKLLSSRLSWAIARKLDGDPSLRKITQTRIGKVAEVSPTAAGYWFGDTNGMNAEQARKLADYLDVDPVWLERGVGEPGAGTSSAQSFDKNVILASMGNRAIPVISAIQAGAMKEIAEPYALGDGYQTVFVDGDFSQWAFGLEIEGDSMSPKFLPGDLVIIEPEWEPRPGDCVAAKNGREEATFKKYRQRGVADNGTVIFELVPLNEDYPTVRSDQIPLTIIGVMAEHRRKTRRR